MRKRIAAIVLVVALALAGCAGTSVETQDAVISTVATDAGYVAYRAVPEARMILASVCLINDFSNPELVAAQLKEIIGRVWEGAEKLTSQDAQMAVLALNNLMAMLNLQLENAQAQRAVAIAKTAIAGICRGVNLAGGIQ